MARSGVLFGPPPASGMKTRNASPITVKPMANFIGLAGCLDPSLVHSAAKTPAITMMKIGLIDWTHSIGIVQPKTVRSSLWSAFSATSVNCCWNSDQNAALATNIGMNATTRRRSTVLILRLERITTK